MKFKKDFRHELQNSLIRALTGMIDSRLRALSFDWGEDWISIHYFYSSVPDDACEIADEVFAEVLADYQFNYEPVVTIEVVEDESSLNNKKKGYWLFKERYDNFSEGFERDLSKRG